MLMGILLPVVHVKAVTCTAPNTPTGCTPEASNTNYTFLAPLPCDPATAGTNCKDNKISTFDPAQPNNLSVYLNIMIRLFIGICAVLAVIMIVVGGLQYMTNELISSKEQGKERIMNAIYGLILALGAYMLLYTINPDLLKTDLGSLESVTVIVDLDTPETPVNGKYTNGTSVGADWASIAGAVASLPNGVTVSPSGDCQKVGDNCTSIRGLRPSYVNTIASNCKCSFVITGGTEFWRHRAGTTHRPGSPTVDLRLETTLNNYITSGQAARDGQRYQKDGISFLKESNHWHTGS